MTGLNDPQFRGPGGKVIVIPIRAQPGKRTKRPAAVRRANQVVNIPADEDIFELLDELRLESRCLKKAILALERLAINDHPGRRGRPSKWISVGKAESKSRASGQPAVESPAVENLAVKNRGAAKPDVAATA